MRQLILMVVCAGRSVKNVGTGWVLRPALAKNTHGVRSYKLEARLQAGRHSFGSHLRGTKPGPRLMGCHLQNQLTY